MADLAEFSVDAAQDSAAAKEIFDREGVLIVKGFFPASVIGRTVSFLRQSMDQIDGVFRTYGFSMHDSDASARATALAAEPPGVIPEAHNHMLLGHFPLEVRLADALREIPRYANIRPLLFDLLSTRRLFTHMPPTARYVLPHCSLAAVPPHQDISYNRHLGEFCVVWVPLVQIDEACGGMAAYRRTNRMDEVLSGELSVAGTGWLKPIKGSALEKAERIVLSPLDLGDAVILDRRTIHESVPNRSDRVRLSCDFRFFGEHSHSTKHYFDISADTILAPAQQGI
jgi:hypothetical protein